MLPTGAGSDRRRRWHGALVVLGLDNREDEEELIRALQS
jgi:hypothetical protein